MKPVENKTSRHGRRQRGSAMILCISMLIFLLLVGLSFLSATRLERMSTSATSRAGNTDAAVTAAIDVAGHAIANDELNYLIGTYATPDFYVTSLTTNHPWLAATAPQPNVGPGINAFAYATSTTPLTWPQISWVGGGTPNFIDANTMQTPILSSNPGHVISIAVVNGGSNYSSSLPPTVTISGGGGSGAAATATVNSNGSVSAITLNPGPPVTTGSNYTSTPTVTIAAPPSPGVTATAIAFLDSTLPAANTQTLPMEPITTTNDNLMASADGSGYADSRWMQLPIPSQDGLTYVAAVRIIDNSSLINVNTATEAEPGRLGTLGYINVLGETPADINLERFLASANFNPLLNWGGSYTGTYGWNADGLNVPQVVGYKVRTFSTSPPVGASLTLSTPTAYVPLPTPLSLGGSGATGGEFAAMAYLYNYLGYIPNPTLPATPAYTAPLTDADRLAFWSVNGQVLGNTSANINSFGVNDEAELRLNNGLNGTAWSPLESILDGNIPEVPVNQYGSGYPSTAFPSRIGILRAARSEAGTTPTTMLTYCQYLADDRRFLTTYSGSRPLRAWWSNPSVDGTVASATVINPGSGYTSAPTVTISAPPSGTQATASPIWSSYGPQAGTVTGITITNPGSGYPSYIVSIDPPNITDGQQAIGVANISGGGVASITILNPGSGYTSAPTVNITSSGGTQATATASISTTTGSVSSITVTNAGTGYVPPPTITISAPGTPGGVTATATASLTGFHYVGPNSPGDYQINPNLANPGNAALYQTTLQNILTQGTSLSTPAALYYEGSSANAIDASYALTANLLAADDPANLYDPIPDAVTNGTTQYYPLRPQPFFKEISATIVYYATSPSNTVTPGSTAKGYFAIELGNPFTTPVNLRNFYIGLATSANPTPTYYTILTNSTQTTDDTSLVNFSIPPGGHVIVYTSGDTDFQNSIWSGTSPLVWTPASGTPWTNPGPVDPTTIDSTHAYTVACPINWTSSIGSTSMTLTLAYKEPTSANNYIIVDSMTSSTSPTNPPTGSGPTPNKYPMTADPIYDTTIIDNNTGLAAGITQTAQWPPAPMVAPPVGDSWGIVSVPGNTPIPGGRMIISATLERDDTEFDSFPFTSDAATFSKQIAHFVYDNPAYNLIATFPPIGIATTGSPIPLEHQMNLQNQVIKSICLTSPGSGYTIGGGPYTVSYYNSDTPSTPIGTATTALGNALGQITSIALNAAATIQYPSANPAAGYNGLYPLLVIGSPPSTGTKATAIAGIGQKWANYVGYNATIGTVPNPFIFQLTSAIPLASTFTYTLSPLSYVANIPAPIQLTTPAGSIPAITITNSGSGYSSTSPPAVTIDAPPLSLITGMQAHAIASVNAQGGVQAITPTNPGTGYLFTSVTIGPPNIPNGIQATARAVINSSTGVSITLVNPGSGYTAAPLVTISLPNLPTGPSLPYGTPATATAVGPFLGTGSPLTAITLVNPGAGYAPMPQIHIAAPSSGTQAMADWNVNNPGAFRTVGDMAMLMTYTNRQDTTVVPWKSISYWLMNPRVSTDLDTINLGRLHFDEYGRADGNPALPVALSLFDNFSTLVQIPIGTQTAPPIIQGQININTAPREVLAMLPYLEGLSSDFVTDPPPHLASALVAYRDMQKLSLGVDYKSSGYTRASSTGINIVPTVPALALRYADAFTSFLSIGEPLMVRVNQSSTNPNPNVVAGTGATASVLSSSVVGGSGGSVPYNSISPGTAGIGYNSVSLISPYTAPISPSINVSPPPDGGTSAGPFTTTVSNGAVSNFGYGPGGVPGSGYDPNNPPAISIASDVDKYDITRLAQTYTDATPGTGDVSGPDGVVGDFKEEMLQYNRISNLITTRSDVFTAYVVLQGRSYNVATGTWQVKVQRRFVVGFDRSNVDGSVANAMPTILYYAEQH